MELYNHFQCLKTSFISFVSDGIVSIAVDEIDLSFQYDSLTTVIRDLTLISKIDAQDVSSGRGVMCDVELKASKIAHSALYARALDKFLFSGPNHNAGACLHQFPVKKDGSGICEADIYVVALDDEGFPRQPLLVGDMKLFDMKTATRETAGSSVETMRIGTDIQHWTIQLGLATTTDQAKLFLYVGSCRGNTGIVHQIEVCHANFVDGNDDTLQAFCSVLFGAVHRLRQQPFVVKLPVMAPFKGTTLYCLTEQVFVDKSMNTVYKL